MVGDEVEGFIRWGEVLPKPLLAQLFFGQEGGYFLTLSMLHPSEPRPPTSAPLASSAQARTWVRCDDDKLLVLDKPGWIVVHPSKNGPWSSLAGVAREEFGLQTIRLIYRLDRETSGVVILAKDEDTGRRLQKAVMNRRLRKLYVAILEGEVTAPVRIEQALGPDLEANVTVRQKVVPAGTPGAQDAVTLLQPLVVRGGRTLVGVELITGRKHQIRAHAEWLGHQVVGDKLYGPDASLYLEFAAHGWTERHDALLPTARQALHCAAIDLRPAGLDYVLTAPWPEDLARFAAREMQLPATEAQTLLDDFVAQALASAK